MPQLAWRLADGATDPRTAWRLMAFGLGGLAVVSFFLPRPWPGALVFVPTQLVAVGTLVMVVLRSRGTVPRAWLTLAIGMTVLGVSLVPFALGAMALTEIALTPVRLTGFGITVVGLAQLTRAGDSEGDASGILDALILGTGAGMVAWFALVQPEIEAGHIHRWLDAIVAIAYPSLEVALVVLIARLAWGQRRLAPFHWLIVASLAAITATDVGLFQEYTALGYLSGQVSDLGWLLGLPLAAAAALHPSARLPYSSPPPGRVLRVPIEQLVAMTAALLVAPVILILTGLAHPRGLHAAIPGAPPAEVELALGMLLMALLVPARLLVIMRARERATRVNRELEARNGKLVQAIDQVHDAILVTGPTAAIEYANPAFERLSGHPLDALLAGNPSMLGSPHSKATSQSMWAALMAGESWSADLVHRRPDGTERTAEAVLSPVRDANGAVTGFVAVERDVTDERATQRERLRLSTAVEQSSDAVIVTDVDGTIEYVNPAFTQISGYANSEVIGQNPRATKSGRQSAAFYQALWRRLARGEVWTGRFSNRRKDGTLYEVEATISPIRGPDGEVNGYLGVERDVTALAAARSALADELRERAAVAAALSRLQPRDSAEATAAAICDELAGVEGIDISAIVTFQGPDHAIILGLVGPDDLPVALGRPLPAARAAYLYERASRGPWAEAWHARPEDGRYGQSFTELGLKATAYAPIRTGEGLLGLVLAGTFGATFASHLVDHLPIVGEFAATASALLAGQVEQGRRTDVARERIKAILATGTFHPVFQPILELDSGRTVGHEALTRFHDGTRPDEVFADARAVSLGLELEAACLAAAIKASEALSPEIWLSLNASPDLILEATTLRMLVEGQSRQIVLEITEHVAIADYAALLAAVATLGPSISLAVDDAGAGFASLHHVVELAPRFLKLDVSLVRNVDGDPTRQAMIAGLAHFAGRTGCVVIAEGIEESAELAMLRELGVPLGQGYLIGRPEPLPKEPSTQPPRT